MKKIFTSALLLLLVLCAAIGMVSCFGVEGLDIDFMVDGEVYETISTNGKEAVKIPENPKKDGYIFDGWYWDDGTWEKSFTANSLLDTPLSSDMGDLRVYAKWTHNHTATRWVTSKAATCTEPGVMDEVCVDCGTVIDSAETDILMEHTASAWIRDKESTCAEAGSMHKECVDCGEILETETLDILLHTAGVAVVETVREVVCGQTPGVYCYIVSCTECGEEMSREYKQVISVHGNSGRVEITEVPATCSSEGSRTRKVICIYCSKVLESTTYTIPKLDHTPTDWIEDVAPTCGDNGSKHKECSVCNETIERGIIAATGEHTYDNDYDADCNICESARCREHSDNRDN